MGYPTATPTPPPAPTPSWTPNANDLRSDGAKRGTGWLGVLNRPDGGVSTELSVQYDDVNGGNPFPLLVPTLDQNEIKQLLEMKDGEKAPESVIEKAIAHAEKRRKEGKSAFKEQ
jgi:hypothetical protein